MNTDDIFHAAFDRATEKLSEVTVPEDKQIKLKHALLDSVWGTDWRQYDNGYAMAYQNIRAVFDAGILPYIEALHLRSAAYKAQSIELHDLKCAIREALCQIEGNKCDLSQGAGSHEALHNAGVQRDLDIIKQCCGEFL